VILHHKLTGPRDGPILLMGPSLGTNVRMWNNQLALADRLRLVRFDYRGHGDSPTPPGPYEMEDLGRDVLDLMDALEVERASYCGISIGGMVGMWLAANAPERLDRLVLLCTAAYLPPASAWEERASVVFGAGSIEPVADAVVDRWLTLDFAAAHPEVRADLRAMLVASSPEGYAWCCGAIARMDLRAELPLIQSPTLVISGSDDQATPVEQQHQIAQAIPGARHEVVGPAAHIVAVEQPELINRLIAEHVLG
jgi:3-oxoadipate enol-lactonase